MARCPFCDEEIDKVYIDMTVAFEAKIENGELVVGKEPIDDVEPLAGQAEYIYCPRCLNTLPLLYSELKDFLRGEIALAPPEECVRKGKFAVHRDEAYRIVSRRKKPGMDEILVLRKLKDETIAAIVKVSLTTGAN